jgi:hypothetical protein
MLPAVVKSSIRTSALIRRDTVSDVARGPDKDKPHLAGMAAFGPKPQCDQVVVRWPSKA